MLFVDIVGLIILLFNELQTRVCPNYSSSLGRMSKLRTDAS